MGPEHFQNANSYSGTKFDAVSAEVLAVAVAVDSPCCCGCLWCGT